MIASTLDDRAAFDARLASGAGARLRADDAAGQAAMRACRARPESLEECTAEIESSLDSAGMFCGRTLRITSAGKRCIDDEVISPAKAAALLKEAQANAGPLRTSPLLIGGVAVAVLAAAWWALR